ncbi:hypothetical protein EJB05_08931, partial [Eragrostis curvula]
MQLAITVRYDEAIDADDDMLQKLKREWGEDVHNLSLEFERVLGLKNSSVSIVDHGHSHKVFIGLNGPIEWDAFVDIMIKGFQKFLQIDSGRRVLGVKEMGRLDKKSFHVACATKLTPKEAKQEASELYTTWEMLLKNTSWKPFKTDAVGDNCEDEAIDVDDDMLQELKMERGEDVHNGVISVLMEMRGYTA